MVSSSYGGGAALIEIVSKGKDAFEVKEIHSYIKKDLNNHHGGMVLVGDYIYFGHDQNKGMPVCVDFNTGEIKWGPIKSPEGGDGSAAVLYADSRLYFRYQNGVMVLIQPNPNSLKVVSSFKLPPPNVKPRPRVGRTQLSPTASFTFAIRTSCTVTTSRLAQTEQKQKN